ncbi:arylamine N-acetyltransferase family protein [Pyruvatibacter sp.]
MSADFDLDAYLGHIGYTGVREPTLDVLKAVHYAQALKVPFENLTVLAKSPPTLDIASLQTKIVDEGRGGYCFEVNALLASALDALGFDVTRLMGRVRWKTPNDVATGRTHMLLHIALPEGPYLADAGFGGITMTGPIPFKTDVELETPHEPRRLLSVDGAVDTYELQVMLGDQWAPVYQFSLEAQSAADYELSNWYTATHPHSIFVQFLIAARPEADRRITLFNTELTIRGRDGVAEVTKLHTVDEIATALADHFDLHLSADERKTILAPHLDGWRSLSAN